jgi:hypothetical protein
MMNTQNSTMNFEKLMMIADMMRGTLALFLMFTSFIQNTWYLTSNHGITPRQKMVAPSSQP